MYKQRPPKQPTFISEGDEDCVAAGTEGIRLDDDGEEDGAAERRKLSRRDLDEATAFPAG